jgi:hypothetical protein
MPQQRAPFDYAEALRSATTPGNGAAATTAGGIAGLMKGATSGATADAQRYAQIPRQALPPNGQRGSLPGRRQPIATPMPGPGGRKPL